MTLWICTSCGASERLNIHPDACSFCGGTLETQDGRSTATREAFDEGLHYLRVAAAEGDTAAIIALWHEGVRLDTWQQSILDNLLLANRVGVMESSYAFIGMAA